MDGKISSSLKEDALRDDSCFTFFFTAAASKWSLIFGCLELLREVGDDGRELLALSFLLFLIYLGAMGCTGSPSDSAACFLQTPLLHNANGALGSKDK